MAMSQTKRIRSRAILWNELVCALLSMVRASLDEELIQHTFEGLSLYKPPVQGVSDEPVGGFAEQQEN